MVLLVVLGGATAIVEAATPRPTAWQRDCERFEGVFYEIGRFDPEVPIGAPVPERGGSSNYRFVGTDLLHCSPECTWGVNSLETSFAFRYDTDEALLRWVAVRSPDGEELARGSVPMLCEDGRVFTENTSGGISRTFVGRIRETDALVIDERGWLVSFSRSVGAGLAWGVVPVAGSSTRKLMEFPPDPAIRLDAATLLARPPAIPAVEREQRASSRVEPVSPQATEPEPEVETSPPPPSFTGPTTVRLIEGIGVQVGGVILTLDGAGYDHGPEDSNHSRAKIVARRGDREVTLLLERDHAGPVTFQSLFDLEIGLEVAVPDASKSLARVLVR